MQHNANKDWQVSSLDGEGIDEEPITELTRMIHNQEYKNVHSFLIARNGKLVHEAYFAGEDGQNGYIEFDEDRPHGFRSATKSITSALIGIAIDRKCIGSVDDPAFTYLPEYAHLFTREKQKITIMHLLTMTAGLQWDQSGAHGSEPDSPNSEAQMENSTDFVEFVLSRPMSDTPGKRFNYNSGCAILLAGIIKNATGMHADEFARKYLFEPMEISGEHWWRTKTGLPQTHAGLSLRPRDAAKIGQLYLDRGRWGNAQLVSARWIDESSRPHGVNERYGFQWWLDELPTHSANVKVSVAEGNGGQFIFVIPDLHMVIVLTGGNYGSPVANQAYPIVIKHILQAVK